MEIDILDSLEELGYSGPLLKEDALNNALELGPKSVEFTELTSWLSKELQVLCGLEENINPVTDPDESSSFLLEVSSFLKELNCPHDCLMEGPISQRLVERRNRVLFLDYLCSELQAACICEASSSHGQKKSLDIELGASTTATQLANLMDRFDVKTDLSESPLELFIQLHSKVDEIVSNSPHLLLPPMLKEELSETQWKSLDKLQSEMYADYKVRREMLLTRLDVTIQSFKWGEDAKGKEDRIAKTYMPLRLSLKTEPDVDLSDLLSAREDITVIEKTSSAALVKNTKSSVNRLVIGNVPDRGGRPKEQKPPVEMPSWKKRTQHHEGGGWRGKRRGKGGKF